MWSRRLSASPLSLAQIIPYKRWNTTRFCNASVTRIVCSSSNNTEPIPVNHSLARAAAQGLLAACSALYLLVFRQHFVLGNFGGPNHLLQ